MLTQPPVYAGPRKPIDPNAPREAAARAPGDPRGRRLPGRRRRTWRFTPDRPASEAEFKRAYARAALAAGLTREQAVGVYSFETGGRGLYDTQAGLEPPRPGAHAISPALGYNQLLSTNTVSMLGEDGGQVRRRAAPQGGGACRVSGA